MKTLISFPAIALFSLIGILPGYGDDQEPEGRNTPEAPQNEREAKEKVTFLGVSTLHLAPPLREHLEIPEGFGIQIHDVVADSPAESAGLKKNDILLRFDDQALISPEHLSLLVRQKDASEQVKLTFLRKGAEETISVELGQIDEGAPRIRPRIDAHRLSPEQWQEHLKQQQDYWQHWMEKRQPERGQENRGGDRARPRPETSGRPPAVSVNPGFPVRVFGTEGVIKIDNDEGEVSITNEEDGHRIVIKDSRGEEVYSGSYNADLGIEGLPEEARDHLKKMKLDNLKILAPQIAEEVPEKTSSPMPPAPSGEPEEIL
jgi:membrane-associated protease RseP (regulator of RpoE activity)